MKNALIEALKEGGRVVVLAVIPVAVDSLLSNQIDVRLLAITGAVAGLRFIDAYLHQSGMAEKGLTRF